jgi:hypothetical protein
MRHHILLVILFSAFSTSAPASPENSAFPKLCAELDLAVISDIELAANAQQIPGEKLAAAFFTVMDARNACAEGRYDEAFAIYDSIAFD